LSDLAKTYGWPGAIWRGAVLSVLERKLQEDVLQMDGIFVNAFARGQGVGTALLSAIFEEAKTRGLKTVQLDVIDTNPKARKLYEKVGFTPMSEEITGPFKWVFGFSSATKMERAV
jgi:ribosomal protein S18 acetylase RimI-like enzyme